MYLDYARGPVGVWHNHLGDIEVGRKAQAARARHKGSVWLAPTKWTNSQRLISGVGASGPRAVATAAIRVGAVAPHVAILGRSALVAACLGVGHRRLVVATRAILPVT